MPSRAAAAAGPAGALIARNAAAMRRTAIFALLQCNMRRVEALAHGEARHHPKGHPMTMRTGTPPAAPKPPSGQVAAAAAAGEPRGDLAARTLAMPADTNPAGDIFGGWIMALMDAAGAMTATKAAGGRVVTAAATEMAFLQPVKVGDVVCCYTDPVRTGRSSVSLHIEVWVLRQGQGARVKVTAAEFTFVALDEEGRPRRIGPGARTAG